MRKYKLYTQPQTNTVHFVTVRGKGQESALLKWRWIQGLIYHLPSPTFTPVFPPLSLPASGPADVTVLFPYSSPPPILFQGQTPLHHYTGMDKSDGGV